MIDISPSATVGYVLLDASYRVVNCNARYLEILRADRSAVVGTNFAQFFAGKPLLEHLFELVVSDALVVRLLAFPHTFEHWASFEEHYYDIKLHLLGDAGCADAMILMRISETLAVPTEGEVRSLLRRRERQQPLFTGEDMDGRTLDVYVHPATAYFANKLTVLAVYRDSLRATTFEFTQDSICMLALAHALHVQS
jgi:hypothetical protein